MEYQFETKGRIIYDAKRGNLKTRNTWWCSIELLDRSLTNYYRWFIDREWVHADRSTIKRKYNKPTHHPHVSLVRGEKPKQNIEQWGVYMADQIVTIRYTNDIRQSSTAFYAKEPDGFWFLDTKWDHYVGFRRYFGLPWRHSNGKEFKGHITIARVYET